MDDHMHEDGEWQNGLCSHVCGGDCGTCWGSYCCSCFLFGRTSERMKNFPDMNKDHFNLFNVDCGILFGAMYIHLGWLPILFKRQELRQKFGIRGNGCQDCLVSYFCSCCALSQMEMEIKDRASTAQQGNIVNTGYTQQSDGMLYAPRTQQADGMQYAPSTQQSTGILYNPGAQPSNGMQYAPGTQGPEKVQY